jgi:hypothetical protein
MARSAGLPGLVPTKARSRRGPTRLPIQLRIIRPGSYEHTQHACIDRGGIWFEGSPRGRSSAHRTFGQFPSLYANWRNSKEPTFGQFRTFYARGRKRYETSKPQQPADPTVATITRAQRSWPRRSNRTWRPSCARVCARRVQSMATGFVSDGISPRSRSAVSVWFAHTLHIRIGSRARRTKRCVI